MSFTILIHSLIVFFGLLLIYQMFSAFHTFREGIDETADNVPTYSDYNENDPLILAKKNAGNIEVLKQRVDDLDKLTPVVYDLSNNVANLNDQMIALTQSQIDTVNSMSTPTTDSTTTTTTVESMTNLSDMSSSLRNSLVRNSKNGTNKLLR